MTRRALPVALAGAGLLGALAVAGPAAAAPTTSYLVAVQPGRASALAADLRESGVEVTKVLSGVDTLVVQAPESALPQLRADTRVQGVSGDPSVALQGATDVQQLSDPGSLFNVGMDSGTRSGWGMATGRGVDVALLDSGVSPVAGLDAAGKVLHGPDLSFDSGLPAMRHLDGFGHGTHLAGIIAGRDASLSGLGDATSFAGVAPDARVVSVKVADAYGNADVSQIIAGIDWVVQNRRAAGMNIRVLNLSLGLPSLQSYKVDPLAHAAEQAWHKGIVVVASAGNNAQANGQLLSPAYDPYLIAVGSIDSKGTTSTTDDGVAAFSNTGTAERSPDVVAPGRSIASLRVPGSYLDQQNPGARLGERFFRGSGTSQSAAVVSGAAAMLLSAKPGMTPDAVKQALRNTAKSLNVAGTAQGKGRVAAVEALYDMNPTAQAHARSTGTGTLDGARGGYRVESGGVALTGEKDVFGKAFSSTAHATAAAAGTAWTGGAWGGTTWTGSAKAADGTWGDVTWAGSDWAGQTWASRAATAATWNGRSWAGGYWNGRSWAGRSWAGRSWATGSWS